MLRLSLPHFFEQDFTLHQENSACRTLIINGAEPGLFDQYQSLFEENDGVLKQQYETDANRFAAIFDGKDAVFLNYFIHTRELQIVTEQDSPYFTYCDQPGEATLTPKVTQLHLEDFGMCYIIHLSDGRFILIDGGREFEADADRLFAFLKENSPDEKPRIAAWVMSHPHCDHFHCFLSFMERHGNGVEIEKLFYNFPEYDDLEHYPKLRIEPDIKNISGHYWLPRFYEWVQKLGVPVYTPHTGQQYRIGDAVIDVLATMDDTIHCTDNINATSLVLRMELGGQTILWTSDAGFGFARLPERYQEALKADILQVPHHGFGCGPWEKEAEGYEYIQPPVCLLPVSNYNAYYRFGPHKWGTRYLMTRMQIHEMITGDTTRTLTLPYFPAKHGAKELAEKFRAGEAACGARAWIFTGLNTAEPGDLVFSLLNMTQQTPKIKAELFFDEQPKAIPCIYPEIGRYSFTKICLSDYAELPQDEPFALRILSDVPIVVSHKNHKETYHS